MPGLVEDQLIYISLGSNEGDRVRHLNEAGKRISDVIGQIIKVSDTYETEPWGMTKANPFLNQVISLKSHLSAMHLLTGLQEIETELGRKRDTIFTSYSTRTIDLDILFYGKLIMDTPSLKIPHPLIPDRRFVLVPLVEIAERMTHPESGFTMKKLLENCKDHRNVEKWIPD